MRDERLSVGQQLGKATASDLEIMAFAAEYDYVFLTHDLDFSAILAATHGEKPSVVQVRTEDVSPSVVGSQVIAALRHVQSELETGALVTVDPIARASAYCRCHPSNEHNFPTLAESVLSCCVVSQFVYALLAPD